MLSDLSALDPNSLRQVPRGSNGYGPDVPSGPSKEGGSGQDQDGKGWFSDLRGFLFPEPSSARRTSGETKSGIDVTKDVTENAADVMPGRHETAVMPRGHEAAGQTEQDEGSTSQGRKAEDEGTLREPELLQPIRDEAIAGAGDAA